ncbi:hypothetical protein DMB65_10075 [Flavobacterium cheongpyeongense]|uniref:Transcriptional regulator n=1 Tax=Flavobacterium cheongpyeongense TaxID=2212651 RepID=A0A2V4C3Z5_9FLAO|nr:hypothetical protein [Flavobacterium cheongpyeongense]PXY40914.1 hypothetical protein DMB65_10075 [Flavobacterium cheongpyeongense]
MEMQALLKYLKLFEKDNRLNVWHFSLLSAVLYLGYRQNQSKIIKVSRSRIMSLSHIKTLPTYHKYFKELQTMGYIKYTPSYHPGYQSEVELLFN